MKNKPCIADRITNYVISACDKLELSESTRSVAIDYAKQIRGETFINGISPTTVAGGIVGAASDSRLVECHRYNIWREDTDGRPKAVTRSAIADALEISRVSVSNWALAIGMFVGNIDPNASTGNKRLYQRFIVKRT